MIHRRSLLIGVGAILAAPAVARASSLMRLRGEPMFIWRVSCLLLPPPNQIPEEWRPEWVGPNGRLYMGRWTFVGSTRNVYTDTVVDFSKEECPAVTARDAPVALAA